MKAIDFFGSEMIEYFAGYFVFAEIEQWFVV